MCASVLKLATLKISSHLYKNNCNVVSYYSMELKTRHVKVRIFKKARMISDFFAAIDDQRAT